MLFNSYQFIFGFLPAACLAYFLAARFGGRRAGIAVLAAASLFFYGWWNARYLWILLLSIGCNAGFSLALLRGEPKQRFWILLTGLGFNLFLLGYFKYASFLADNVNVLLGVDWKIEPQALPLGISFFTFQKIAFLVDVYVGGVVSFDLLHYALFVTFFPQLIAGPIVRHNEIMPQFQTLPRHPRASDFAIGASIFGIGLFKKVCLADPSAALVTPVFSAAASGAPVGFVDAWTAALAYSFQLYFDFSGYSDMAIGLARLFGIVLPINFYSPYKSVNIIDFWRRWHISLSRFLRDFIYIPLGGNRHGVPRRYLNLAIAMLLGGLWHGAAWTFVLWGAMHGLMLALNHGWHYLRRRIGLRPWKGPAEIHIAACALTFVAVTSAWVLFRAPSLASAGTILAAMYGVGGHDVSHQMPAYWVSQLVLLREFRWSESSALWLLLVGSVAFILPNTYQLFQGFRPALVERRFGDAVSKPRLRWSPNASWAVGLSLMLLIAVLRMRELSPFIYFQF
jgi:D-alanyl-lipoteichoic acid acyltransferase DltB (MBOAT superfamily)